MTRRRDDAVRIRRRGADILTRRAGLAVLTALSVLLASCSAGAPDAQTPQDTDSTAAQQSGASKQATGAPDDAAGLQEFYGQQIDWSECDGAECATLRVPIDYAAPSEGAIELALLRVAAEGDRIGSLVVNPGGPGASGVDYAESAGLIVSPEVAQAYDVVGFDPRGVARSAPIECYDDAQMDDLLGSDPSPDDDAEQAEIDSLLEDFADACGQAAPDLLAHVSTIEVARDMDVLRAALGEEQLDYLGASYGTFIGATYAALFPDRVGRFVLDGALEPTLSSLEIGRGQAGGFEQATRSYVQDCIEQGDCPLGDDVDAGMQRITDFLDDVDADPIAVSGDTVTELTEGWALLGIVVAMYDQSAWPILTEALQRAFDGDGTSLMFLANIYADRTAEGDYNGNGNQAIYAVNCLDRPATDDNRTQEEIRAEFEEVAPTFGRYLAGEGACEYWPAEAAETIEDYSAVGAAPIVVIGTTGDPATPYEWAVRLADILDSGVLISYEGEGHTAYGRSNGCVDDAVDAYLLEGTVPKDALSC